MAEYSQKWHNGTSKTRSTKTSDGLSTIQAQLNNLGREIKKVNEKVYASQVGCEQCKGPHYTKDFPNKEEGTTLEEAYYTQFGGPFQGGGYKAPALGSFIPRTKAIYERYPEQFYEQMSMVLQQRGFGSLPSSTKANPRDQVKSISTTIEADSYPIRRASVSVMPLSTYLNLGLGELAYAKLIVELADKIVKYPKGIAENVLVDYIELNDLNKPFELRKKSGDDFDATIRKGEVLRNLELRMMNLILELMITLISQFLEDMDAYRDEGMGDVIFGEPFLREVGIKARRFEGMITIYNGNNSVSDEDKKNGISHPYQKLKGFYKGVLNLGPDYIRDAKTEEWLIREHISVHEMEW
ncbi:hypothetical protein Tco_0442634 [Tanacetum coccineum]